MRCPLCAPARLIETSILEHILVAHPTARNATILAVTVGSVALARRPQQLYAFYGVLLLVAFVIAQPPQRLA